MPDTFSTSLIIMSLYFGSNYLETNLKNKKWLYLFFYFAFFILGALSKLPAGYALSLFLIYMFIKEIPISRKLIFVIASLTGLIPISLWYFYWVEHLVTTYGFWHFFMGNSFLAGMQAIGKNLADTLDKFYNVALKFIGFAVSLYGLWFAVNKTEKKILLVFSVAFLSFLVIVFKGGSTFAQHAYYIVPFVPVMALVAGYALSNIKSQKIVLTLLFAIVVEGIANQQHDFRISSKSLFLINIEKDLDKVSSRKDLILINSGSYPTAMYFSHRKGWINTNEKIANEQYRIDLKKKDSNMF